MGVFFTIFLRLQIHKAVAVIIWQSASYTFCLNPDVRQAGSRRLFLAICRLCFLVGFFSTWFVFCFILLLIASMPFFAPSQILIFVFFMTDLFFIWRRIFEIFLNWFLNWKKFSIISNMKVFKVFSIFSYTWEWLRRFSKHWMLDDMMFLLFYFQYFIWFLNFENSSSLFVSIIFTMLLFSTF